MTCLQSDRRKQLQRKDRVYQHVQNQMADQAAARAANKDRVERVREHACSSLDVMVLDKSFLQESFELFVDRQRQAAVVLGERDIAGDVKAKRKRDRQAI